MLRVVLSGPRPDRAARASSTARCGRSTSCCATRSTAAAPTAERDDVLSLLLQARHEDGEPMDDAELRDELLTLLVAGHETTATALAWALERLARHPAAWERLRERRRRATSTPWSRRRCGCAPCCRSSCAGSRQPMEIGGWELPAGRRRSRPASTWSTGARTSTPSRTRFRPERFLERPAGTYTWIPFGGGVRRCLGASFALFEMKLVLRAVAAGVERLAPDRPESEPVSRRSITLVPGREGRVVVGV